MRRRKLAAEILEHRQLLAVDLLFQNPFQRFDVNQDLRVTSVDALQIINELARREGDSTLAATNEIGRFYDVNGVNGITALDALQVINRVGREEAILSARLIHDSAFGSTTNYDLITDQYGVELRLTNAAASDRVEARIDGAADGDFVDVTDGIEDGRIGLSESLLDTIAGAALDDGDHRFEFRIAGQDEILSAVVTIDRTAPSLDTIAPADTSVATDSKVKVTFSESMDEATLNSISLKLVNRADASVAIQPLSISLNGAGDEVELDYGSLSPGVYEFTIDSSAVADTAGNAMGGADVVSVFTVAQHEADAVWISTSDGSWTDPANWRDGRVPMPGDQVLISVANDITVTIGGFGIEINGLVSDNVLNFSFGRITVADTIRLNAESVVSGHVSIVGGRVSGSALTVTSNLVLEGVTVNNQILVQDGLIEPKSGLTINGSITLSGADGDRSGSSTMLFREAVDHTLDGDGEVIFLGDSNFNRIEVNSNGSLSIGSGITLRTDGTLGDKINLSGASWTSAGVIDARDAVVTLGGKFDTANLDPSRLLRNAQSQIIIGGTVDNVGNTLTIDSEAAWLLNGTVLGGTISGSPMSFGAATLDDVTLNTNLVGGQTLRVGSRLTGSGRVDFGEARNGLQANSLGPSSFSSSYTIGVTVDIGSGQSLEILGDWDNQGLIDARDAVVFLGGTFQTADIKPERLQRNSGSTIFLSGDLDNTGENLNLEAGPNWRALERRNSTSGSRITGGTLSGSILTVPDGLNVSNELTLDGVIIDNDILVENSTSLVVPGDLTLNGTVTLTGSESDRRDFALLRFGDGVAHTLSGTGDVIFSGAMDTSRIEVASGASLTIASGVTLRTDGTPGDKINLGGDGMWSNAGVIDGRDAVVNLDGNFGTASISAGRLLRSSQSEINILGSLDNVAATLEIDSQASWLIDAGVVSGGVISGSPLSFTSATLDNVTLNNSLTGGPTLIVQDRLIGSGQVDFTSASNTISSPPFTTDAYTIGVTVSVGSSQSLKISGTWDNQGLIDASDATLILDGIFQTTDIRLDRLQRNSGSTIILLGNLDNGGETLNLEPGPTWFADSKHAFAPSQITGGTISGSTLSVIGDLELTDVTVDNDLLITDRSSVKVLAGLTLNGTVTLDGSGSGGLAAARLTFSGGVAHTLDGNGTVIFIGESDSNAVDVAFGDSLMIASGITLRTDGTLGDKINLGGDGSWTSTGVIDGRDSVVNLGGSFAGTSLDAARLLRNTQSVIKITGVVDNAAATLEIDSEAAWLIDSGEVLGGTLSGSPLSFTSAVLDGVILDNDLVGGPTLIVRNSLTGSGQVDFTEASSTISSPPGSTQQYTIGVNVNVGSGQSLEIRGWWNNQGVIDVRDATLRLGAGFTGALNKTSDIAPARLLRNDGSTIIFGGLVDNTDSILVLESGPTWQSVSGQFLGGVISGSTLFVDSLLSLDGVTVNNDISIAKGSIVSISNGLTLNGSLTLNATGVNRSRVVDLNFVGGSDHTLDGSGEIIFASDSNGNRLVVSSPNSLIIESGITIRATGGAIFSQEPLVNRGRIVAEGDGSGLQINVDDFLNEGSLFVGAASHMEIVGNLTQTGILEIAFDGTTDGTAKVTVRQGGASLSGVLNVVFVGGFVPTAGQSLLAMSFDTRAGTAFDTINGLDLGGGVVLQPQYGNMELRLER